MTRAMFVGSLGNAFVVVSIPELPRVLKRLIVLFTLLGLFLFSAGHSAFAAPVHETGENLFDFSPESLQLEELGIDLPSPIPHDELAPNSFSVGEDLGHRSAVKDVLLGRVVQHMRDAEVYLEEAMRTTPPSAAQAQALEGLDAMIEELLEKQNQCSGSQCKKPSPPKQATKPSSQTKSGSTPAEVGLQTFSRSDDLDRLRAATGELVKNLWGKLPDRQREQILQPLREEFLPKYAAEIEKYFRALADPAALEESER